MSTEPAMLRTAVRHILLLIPLLCCTLLADGQVLDSAAEARIKDTVDRYYRLHPRRHPSHRPSEFRVMPLFGAMYTQETEFLAMGGFMGSGRTSEDTLAPPSTVGAVLMISTNLSAAGAITGAWVSRRGDFLIQYSAAYIYGPRYFWGLGYEAASLDGNRGRMVSHRARARADLLYRRGSLLKAGGFVSYAYLGVLELTSSFPMEGEPMETHYAGVGARLDLDTRDSSSEPSRGILITAEESVHFNLRGGRPFFRTEVTADFYLPLWEGGVLALDLYGQLNSRAAPWTVWPDAGGDIRLRGYYRGRYRDRNLLSAQMELRQRVYGPHGLAVWGGAGNVFPSFRELDIKNTLPTYGAGYRFSFLGLVLRLDAGFGLRGQWAVTAGVSHSF